MVGDLPDGHEGMAGTGRGTPAEELHGHGFVFVGPTTTYSLMEAVGIVDAHLLDSPVAAIAGRGPR